MICIYLIDNAKTRLKSKCNDKALIKKKKIHKPAIADHFQLECIKLSKGEQLC